MSSAYVSHIATISRSLGIPADYARVRHMPLQREARTLVSIGRSSDGRIIRLAPRAAQAWRKMRTAAALNGIGLLPVSGFRSIARQTRIIRSNLAKGRPLDDLLRYVAAPGCSEHHTGRALDIASARHPDLDAGFARGSYTARKIHKNYRNSRQILRAASKLANHYGSHANSADQRRPHVAARHGKKQAPAQTQRSGGASAFTLRQENSRK